MTRAATDAQLGEEVIRQITAYPGSLFMVCIALAGLLFIQSIPVFPVILVLLFCALVAGFAVKNPPQKNAETAEINLYDTLKIYPIEVQLNPLLFDNLQIQKDSILPLLQVIREKLALDSGIVIPEIKLKSEQALSWPFYQISIQGNIQNAHPLYLDKILAFQTTQENPVSWPDGIAVIEPVYGLPATWLSIQQSQIAQKNGWTVSEPLQVLITHLQESLQQHLPLLLDRKETITLLAQENVKALADDLMPHLLSASQIQRILQNLLQEKVSLRPLAPILEVLLEHAKQVPDPAMLTELVRANLASTICRKLLDSENTLSVLTLEPDLEQVLSQQLHKDKLALTPAITESFLHNLITETERMLTVQKRPVLLCAPLLRRALRQLTQRIMPHLTILGMNEIPVHIPVQSFGTIRARAISVATGEHTFSQELS